MKRTYKAFIPKSSPIQPDAYRIIGLDHAALFIVDTEDKSYQSMPDMPAHIYIERVCHNIYNPSWDGVEVLVQGETSRQVIYRATSIKDAIQFTNNLINKIKK